jgi:hypothetical protein
VAFVVAQNNNLSSPYDLSAGETILRLQPLVKRRHALYIGARSALSGSIGLQ